MNRPVRLGYDPDFAPFSYLEAGRPKGAALELVRSACSRARIRVAFLAGGLDERAGQLARGEVDGLACMAVTARRAAEFDFSLPYLTTGAAFFTLCGVPTPSTPEAAAGLTVATPETGPVYAYLRSAVPSVTLLGVPGYREALEAVVGGAAAAALNADAAKTLCGLWFPGSFARPGSRFMETGLAVAMPVGAAKDFLAALDAGLAATLGDMAGRVFL